jgi:hypothetical protein
MIEREEIAVRLLEKLLSQPTVLGTAELLERSPQVAVILTDSLLDELSKEERDAVTPEDILDAASDNGIHVVEVGTQAAVGRVVALLKDRGIVA